MEKLTDAQRAKADLLGVKNILWGARCELFDSRIGAGFYVMGFHSNDDLSEGVTGTAWANADDLLNALAAPEKYNCWRKL